MSKVAAAILAQFPQELAQLRSGVVAQLDLLGSELGALAVGKRIGSAEDVVEERERGFELEVMGGASARGSPPRRTPPPSSRGKVSRTKPSAAAQAIIFSQARR